MSALGQKRSCQLCAKSGYSRTQRRSAQCQRLITNLNPANGFAAASPLLIAPAPLTCTNGPKAGLGVEWLRKTKAKTPAR